MEFMLSKQDNNNILNQLYLILINHIIIINHAYIIIKTKTS